MNTAFRPSTAVCATSHQRGATLIELLVSVTLGAVLMIAMVQLLSSSSSNNRLISEISRMQESARISLNTIRQRTAVSSYSSCRQDISWANTIIGSGLPANWQLRRPGVEGWNDAQADAELPPDLAAARFPNTDILIARGASAGRDFAVSGTATGTITLSAGGSFPYVAGDRFIVTNAECTHGAIIAASDVTDETITYGASHNCEDAQLKGNQNYTDCTNGSFTGVLNLDGGALLRRYDAAAFYIGASDEDPSLPALRRKSWRSAGVEADEELVSGVENMQLLFGYDSDGDKIANVYAKANDTSLTGGSWDWQNVVNVRISLLFASRTPLNIEGDRLAVFEGFDVPDDGRLRKRFSTVVQLKNLGLN